MEQIIIKSKYDGSPIYAILYKADNCKGIVQIIHGMKEHQERYRQFALFLNENGYSVVTSDLRGHGKNAILLGHIDAKKPWKALLLDQVSISEYIKNEFPNQDLFLFAHSMGTIIARNLIQNHASFYKKIVLSGVPAYQFACHFGILLANIMLAFKKAPFVSKMLEKQTLRPFEKAVPNALTPADWISVNRDNIENYLKDPYCNIPFYVSAYSALYHLVRDMHKSKLYSVSDPHKPILFLVGQMDPCTLGPRGVQSSIRTLKKAGYLDVNLITYENMRHEILNEVEYKKVYTDILEFIE